MKENNFIKHAKTFYINVTKDGKIKNKIKLKEVFKYYIKQDVELA